MDSVTQFALGAAVGEAVLGRKVGNRAPLWGGLVATVPDLDVIPGQFLDPVARLAFHRGVTHSILFAVALAPLLGGLLARLRRNAGADRHDWTRLSFWALVTHPLLDCFTTWGTQLFWPLPYRVAINSIFVVDPLYTLPLVVTLIWLARKRDPAARRRLNWIGLGLSSLYLALTLVNKGVMNQRFEEILAEKQIPYTRFMTRPTPLNNVLWTASAETETGFYIVHHSLLDGDRAVPVFFLPKNHELLGELAHHERVQKLLSILNYYIVEPLPDGVLVHDIRFGQVGGWHDGRGEFVFSYEIRAVGSDGATAVEIRRRSGSVRFSRDRFAQLLSRITRWE